MRILFAVLASLFTLSSLTAQTPDTRTTQAKNGVVVCVSPPAADVGLEILKKGGNAVDAAVAIGFAQAVTWPEAGNIGGGGFMMVYPGNGKEPILFEYRETAPAAAKRDMFASGKLNAHSHQAAGVPGTVRGFALAHAKFGKLPWKDVVMPAVKLAEDGFTVNAVLARGLNNVLKSAETTNAEFKRVYGKNGGKAFWDAGDKLVLADLGRTLRRIAENGPDAFYTGEIAGLLEAEMKDAGHWITKADLAAYAAQERKPIHGTYRGFDIYGPSPPSGGGTVLVEALNILENFDLAKHDRWSPEANHLILEAMKRAYCDRARHLGDPAFTAIPTHLTDKGYAKKLAAGIDPKKATPSETLAPEIKLDTPSDSTTHYSVVDKDGMAVSNTYTLEHSYGNRVVVRGAGYILNNEMTDFNPKPGLTTRGGVIGTKPNQAEPGKRMLSSQTPTFVSKDGQLRYVVGSPGGRTISNTVLCVLVNVLDYGMDLRSAVDAPRWHHQWFPDVATFEGAKEHADLVAKLKALGQAVEPRAKQGDAHSIAIDPKTGMRIGVADKRLDGKAAGY
jgi:gamma-glutamyltranspeptidase/glutathione hydrolase